MSYEVKLSSEITRKWKINYETIFCKDDWRGDDDWLPLLSDVYPEVLEVRWIAHDFIFVFKYEMSYTLFLLKMEPRV